MAKTPRPLETERLRLLAHSHLAMVARLPNPDRRLRFVLRAIQIAAAFSASPIQPDTDTPPIQPDNGAAAYTPDLQPIWGDRTPQPQPGKKPDTTPPTEN